MAWRSNTQYLLWQSNSGYDAIDDLAYAKQIKTTTVTENGRAKQVIDPDSIKLFYADDPAKSDCIELSKIVGFMLSTHKASAIKHDEHDANFTDLLKRVETLENKLKQNQA